ncbi:MAG: hypothetical protein KC609_00475 [Myxococcales bacterium]|nr:hypothetical protein [Myxococcales bacterium]
MQTMRRNVLMLSFVLLSTASAGAQTLRTHTGMLVNCANDTINDPTCVADPSLSAPTPFRCTWKSSEKHVVDNSIGGNVTTLPACATLVIEPGTTVMMASIQSLRINGPLVIDAADNPVLFTFTQNGSDPVNNPTAGSWGQLRIENDQGATLKGTLGPSDSLKGLIINGGGFGAPAFQLLGPLYANNVFGDEITITLAGVTVKNSFGDAIHFGTSGGATRPLRAKLVDPVVDNVTNDDGIDVRGGSIVEIVNPRVTNVNDNGIQCGSPCSIVGTPGVSEIRTTTLGHGLVIASSANVSDLMISDTNNNGVLLTGDNPGATITLKGVTISETGIDGIALVYAANNDYSNVHLTLDDVTISKCNTGLSINGFVPASGFVLTSTNLSINGAGNHAINVSVDSLTATKAKFTFDKLTITSPIQGGVVFGGRGGRDFSLTIRDSVITNTCATGPGCGGGPGISVINGSLILERSTLGEIGGSGVYVHVEDGVNRDSRIENTLVYALKFGDTTAIRLNSANVRALVRFNTLDGTTVSGNCGSNPSATCGNGLTANTSSVSQFVGNIVTNFRGTGIGHSHNQTLVKNDAFGNKTAQGADCNYNFEGTCAATGPTGNANLDPNYTSIAKQNFHLNTGSPSTLLDAIDPKDTAVFPLDDAPTVDHDGLKRIGWLDRGAFEGPLVIAATITPNTGKVGETLTNVGLMVYNADASTVFGMSFPGAGTDATIGVSFVSIDYATHMMKADVTIGGTSKPGKRDVTGDNGVTSLTRSNVFTVLSAPLLDSPALAPSVGAPGQTLQITISGSGFYDDPSGTRLTVTLGAPADNVQVSVDSVSVDGTTIIATVTIPAAIQVGSKLTLSVTNSDGEGDQAGNAFTIVSVAPIDTTTPDAGDTAEPDLDDDGTLPDVDLDATEPDAVTPTDLVGSDLATDEDTLTSDAGDDSQAPGDGTSDDGGVSLDGTSDDGGIGPDGTSDDGGTTFDVSTDLAQPDGGDEDQSIIKLDSGANGTGSGSGKKGGGCQQSGGDAAPSLLIVLLLTVGFIRRRRALG